MRREDRSSISTYPLADLRWKLLIGVTSSLAPHIARFLCSSQGPFLRPGPQNVDRVARRGGQGQPSRLVYGWAPALPGCALTAPSTARGSSGSGACSVSPPRLEGASCSQHRPGDAAKL